MPDPTGEGGGRTVHGPSSTGAPRGCRSPCAGLAYGSLTLAWYGQLLLPSQHALVPRFWQTRALTDVLTFLYHCLPNHRSALAKGVGGGPSFQGDPGLLLANY